MTPEEQQRMYRVVNSYREVHHLFFQKLLKAAQPYGLTPGQLLVLRVLDEHPHITLAELAKHMHLGSSTVSGIVDRMEKSGLVARERVRDDRRAVSLSLTARGAEVRETTQTARLELMAPMLALSNEELDRIVALNERIVQLLKTESEELPDDDER